MFSVPEIAKQSTYRVGDRVKFQVSNKTYLKKWSRIQVDGTDLNNLDGEPCTYWRIEDSGASNQNREET